MRLLFDTAVLGEICHEVVVRHAGAGVLVDEVSHTGKRLRNGPLHFGSRGFTSAIAVNVP